MKPNLQPLAEAVESQLKAAVGAVDRECVVRLEHALQACQDASVATRDAIGLALHGHDERAKECFDHALALVRGLA